MNENTCEWNEPTLALSLSLSLSLCLCVCVLDHQQLFLDNELLFNYVCFPPYNNNKKKT
jgi:hypothetical protein